MNLESKEDWDNMIEKYISPSKLFNYFLDDPLLDYLEQFGSMMGYLKNECPEDVITIMNKGCKFEERVIHVLRKHKIPIIEICKHSSWVDGSLETLQLMSAGFPIIAQGYLVNNINKTKGRPDIIIRSDYLNKIKPGIISDADAKIPSKFGDWHYRIIDIKMSNLGLSVDGKHIINTKLYKAYKAQVLIYNMSISLLQDYLPSQAYLLGRSGHNYDNSIKYDDCFSSMTAVDFNDYDSSFIDNINNALLWHQTLKTLPLPSIIGADENGLIKYDWDTLESLIPKSLNLNLRPNMKNKYDYKWKDVKKQIATQRQELTLLWNCGVAKRNKAISNGITNWDDYLIYCQENPGYQNNVLGCILEVNDPKEESLIQPNKLDEDNMKAIPSKTKPFIVIDFETSNNLNDLFEFLPEKGGQDLVFLIGVTLVIPNENNLTEYRYFSFMVKYLDLDEELIILKKMLKLLNTLKNELKEDRITLYHWSKAEPIFFEKMLERQFDVMDEDDHQMISDIDFLDILDIFKYQPITIKGAYDFGLKTIANAMYKNGMIQTIWENDLNGFTVMLQINKYNKEAFELGLKLTDYQEVNNIITYNMIDCQVLAEIIVYLQNKYLTQK
jgi:hypothetical protein